MRCAHALVASLISGLLFAAPAVATTTIDLSDDGSRLTVQGDPRERNRIVLYDPTDDPGGQEFLISEYLTDLTSNTPACDVEKQTFESGAVRWFASCETSGLRGVTLRTRGRNDFVRLQGPLPDVRRLRAELGSGEDQIVGYRSLFPNTPIPLLLDGGTGDDELHGGSGPDLLIGGGGVDVLSAASGGDRVDAQDGEADQFLHCGDGEDSIVLDAKLDPSPSGCES